MAYLQNFTTEQRELLVSLPYRTGLWVSESDEGGGEDSSTSEMQVLEGLITGYAEDFLKSEFVEELLRETLAQKSRWPAWSSDLAQVPGQCREAVKIVSERLEARDVLSFRQNLMEIAVTVAMAYREEGEGPDKISVFSGQYWNRLFSRLKGESAPSDGSENISRAERRVLMELSNALQVDFNGNPLKNAAAA